MPYSNNFIYLPVVSGYRIFITYKCKRGVVESIEKFGKYFKGYESVPAFRAVLAYQKSVDGVQTGQVLRYLRQATGSNKFDCLDFA